MEALYILNLMTAVALMFAPFWWSRRLLDQGWLNPVTLMVICMMPIDFFRLFVGQMYLGDGLIAPSYQFAVLMTNLQQSITIFLLVLASQLKITRGLPSLIPRLGQYSTADLRRLSRLFFLLYLAAFVILAIRTGGVGSWLSDIRGSYIEKREGNGLFYAAAVSFLSISYFFEGISSSRSRGFALRSLIYFGAIYVLGSKGFVLQFFIFSLIIFHRQGQVNIGRVLLIGLPAAFTLLLINFASQREALDFSGVAEYFDYYPNAAMYYADYFRGAISLFHGEVILTSFWEYVPRSFFPDKPFVYGILKVTEIYYPGGAESGNTPAFQGAVPQFADFGVPGVLFFALFNWVPLVYFAGLRYALQSRFILSQGPMTGRTIVVCLLLFAPSFGSFLPLGLVILLLLFIVALSKFLQMARRTLLAV